MTWRPFTHSLSFFLAVFLVVSHVSTVLGNGSVPSDSNEALDRREKARNLSQLYHEGWMADEDNSRRQLERQGTAEEKRRSLTKTPQKLRAVKGKTTMIGDRHNEIQKSRLTLTNANSNNEQLRVHSRQRRLRFRPKRDDVIQGDDRQRMLNEEGAFSFRALDVADDGDKIVDERDLNNCANTNNACDDFCPCQ